MKGSREETAREDFAPVANDKADDNALFILEGFEILPSGHPCLSEEVSPRPRPQTLHISALG